MLGWIENHFNTLHHLQINAIITDDQGKNIRIEEGFKRYINHIKKMHKLGGKIMFIGNGGSAGIASHLAIDYSKNGYIPAMAFNDPSALTCLSNDFGYEHVFAKQIEFHGRKGDVLVAISSSGRSDNIIKAVLVARAIEATVITFSGFDANNPLSRLGDLNFYIASKEYAFVEVAHLSLAHAMLEYIIKEPHIKAGQRTADLVTE